MDQVVFKGIVEIVGIDGLSLQEAALNPADLTATLLVDQQPRAELLRLDLEEASQFLQIHGGVQFQVRADGGVEKGVLDLIHEDGSLVVDRVNVEGWIVEVRRSGADELGAGRSEEFLEERNSLGATVLETDELFTILLPQSRVDGVIEAGGVESNADGNQSIHLVVLLGNSIVTVAALLEVLCPGDIDQDVAEHADGVTVAAHHHVGEPHIVVSGEVSCHHTGKHGLLVHLNIIEGLQGKAEVSEQAVDTEESDNGEVPEHFIQWARTILASKRHWVLTTLDSSQLLIDLGSLN